MHDALQLAISPDAWGFSLSGWQGRKALKGLLWCGEQNFDEVLVPADHVSRSPNDTYYIDTETVLRCHTSAHQAETLRKGERAFLVTGLLFMRP